MLKKWWVRDASHPLYWLETVKLIIWNNVFMFQMMHLADLQNQNVFVHIQPNNKRWLGLGSPSFHPWARLVVTVAMECTATLDGSHYFSWPRFFATGKYLSSCAGAQHARYLHQCQDEAPQGQGSQYIHLWMKIFCYKQRQSVESQESSVWWRLRLVWRWCVKCDGRKTTITNQIGLWLAECGGTPKCSFFMEPCTSQHNRLISM